MAGKREDILNATLAAEVESIVTAFDEIPADRKSALVRIAEFTRQRVDRGERARLTFICTHNSRRSHLAQIWAQLAADYYGVAGVECHSAGTEATALNPRVVDALQHMGFVVVIQTPGDNPVYRIAWNEQTPPLIAFSKTLDDESIPSVDHCAVMTCSDADANCPFVPGAAERVALPYDDPKNSDGSASEASVYYGRARQIACEMLYCLSICTS